MLTGVVVFASSAKSASICAPPVNSTPKLNPFVMIEPIETMARTPDSARKRWRFPMKS